MWTLAEAVDDEFLRPVQPDEVRREKQKVMSDRDASVAGLDEIVARFAAEEKGRNLDKGAAR